MKDEPNLHVPTGTQSPIAQVLKLLRKALTIIDAEKMPAEIGARLDHVIHTLEELSK